MTQKPLTNAQSHHVNSGDIMSRQIRKQEYIPQYYHEFERYLANREGPGPAAYQNQPKIPHNKLKAALFKKSKRQFADISPGPGPARYLVTES